MEPRIPRKWNVPVFPVLSRYNIEMSERHPQPTPQQLDYGEQDENGIDLSLIRENLRLTPLERIRKADVARRQTLKLIEYGRRHRQDAVRANH